MLPRSVNHAIILGMGHRIGLDPDDIRVPDQIDIENEIPVHEPDISRQHRPDRLQPGIMAAENDGFPADLICSLQPDCNKVAIDCNSRCN